MFPPNLQLAARKVVPIVVLIAVSAGYLSISSRRLEAQEPVKPEAKGTKQKELLKERLVVVREIVNLSTEAYKVGAGSYDEVREATRMVLDAELQQCDSDKERIAVLEKYIVDAKKMEEHAAQLSKTGQASTRTALKAKADRLQAEIALERAKTEAVGSTSLGLHDRVALAEKQILIKGAGIKVAEVQKKMAIAKFASVKAQIAEARAAESFAEKQVNRLEELLKSNAVDSALVDERRMQWDACKARRTAAEGKVLECEAQVLLEQARIDLAHLEAEEAALRLKQLKTSLETNR